MLKFALMLLLALKEAQGIGTLKDDVQQDNNHQKRTAMSAKRVSVYPNKAHRCDLPLGMEDGRILDHQITASSSKSTKNGPNRGRLGNTGKNGAWSCSSTSNGCGWLQIDLGEITMVTKIATQGRYDADEWVKTYYVYYSIDGVHWAECKTFKSTMKYFSGNNDRNTVVTNTLHPHIYARYVKIHAQYVNKRASMRVELYGCRNVQSCSIPLGMEDKRIPDNAISASYYYSSYYPRYARLNYGSAAWSAGTSSGQYLQIDLGEVKTITRVATQGFPGGNPHRTTSYYLQYSIDGLHWAYYRKPDTNAKYFPGNSYMYGIRTNTLEHNIIARYVRFRPQAYKHWYCLRVEMYGCKQEKQCLEPLGVEDYRIKKNEMTASSTSGSHYSYRARINVHYGWIPSSYNKNQWLQINLRTDRKITAVATQGYYGGSYWVTTYKLRYSINGNHWIYVKENGIDKVFHGNADYYTLVRNSLVSAIHARYVRFHPQSWSKSGISMRVEVYGCRGGQLCNKPVGMEDGRVDKGAITASSIKKSGCSADRGRLNSASAWCPKNKKHEWLQVHLPRLTLINKIATQGNQAADQWTSSYRVLYSTDGRHWDLLRNPDGEIRVFQGNSDRSSIVINKMIKSVAARYVRVIPLTWHKAVAMRIELYGCHNAHHCSSPLGMEDGRIRSSEIRASSFLSTKHDPRFSRIHTKKQEAWCTKTNDSKQWLQIDLRITKTVTKIALQGVPKGWVKSYTLSYGVTEHHWMQYKQNGKVKVFLGNYNADSFVTQDIHPSIHARFIRIQPTAWHGRICMRIELYGCLVEGIGE